jgi:PIN domain nuclease of toxin-antitoxin system
MPIPGTTALRYFGVSGYQMVDVSPADSAAVDSLPAHHADPIDRMPVAQALTGPFRLLTHDANVARSNASIIQV